MKLIINRLVDEFNKIFNGSKRVGDTLKLEGKRMSQLDVANAAKLGLKTESQLNVNGSVLSEKSITLQSFDVNGVPKVNVSGDPVYIKEHQLSVNNSQLLGGVEPLNLEVDIASRLRIDATKVINVSNLIVNPALYRVKDSELLGGKTENTLSVSRSADADNADLLNDTAQNQLVVEKARIASKLLSDDGQEELKESELKVHDAVYMRNNTSLYDIFQLRDWLVSQEELTNVYVDLSASSDSITTSEGNKSFSDILSYLKNNSSSEMYKATVTGAFNTKNVFFCTG